MKKMFKFSLIAFACSALVLYSSCSDDSDDDSTTIYFVADGSVDELTVLEDFAQDIIIEHYVALADASKTLYEKVSAITLDGGTQEAADMTAACQAWEAARLIWGRTEAYLFGPVRTYSIYSSVASYTIAVGDLAASIINYCDGTYTDSDITSNSGSLKGFHAIEYMLFKDGEYKTKMDDWDDTYGTVYGLGDGSPTSAELKSYLVAITKELYRCTSRLVAEWDNTNPYLSNYSEVYTSGDEQDGDYYVTFTTAGSSSNSDYSSCSEALGVIVYYIADLADEIDAVKIEDPIETGDVLDVESWFSYNSVPDFINNMVGIKEAYYGIQYSDSANSSSTTTGEAASGSIGAYIASGNAELDAEIREAIDTALDAVAAMNTPFRDNLTWDSKNTAAASACATLSDLLEDAQDAIEDGYYTD